MKKKIKGIWFFGLSGSGKSDLSNYLRKRIKKKILIIDGDQVRKHISNDLGYSLKDRKIQICRILGLINLSIESNIFFIASTVYIDNQILKILRKKNILACKVHRKNKSYTNKKFSKYAKNIIGKDIFYSKNLIGYKKILNKGDKSFYNDLNGLLKAYELVA